MHPDAMTERGFDSYGAYMHAQHVLEQQQLLAEHKLMEQAQMQAHEHEHLQAHMHAQMQIEHAKAQAAAIQAAAFPGALGRKRKASDEEDALDGLMASNLAERRKLTLPRCMPGTMNEEAKFHPLPEDLNRQMLASINAAALQQGLQQASMRAAPVAFPGSTNSPSSPMSELQPGTPRDGFFGGPGAPAYPEFALYPSAPSSGGASDTASTSRTRLDSAASGSTTATAFGIFEPAAGSMAAEEENDGMCLDSAGVGSAHASAWDAAMPTYPPPPPPGHGPHCKSIPQLSVRTYEGTGSELWATCNDCGASTKVQGGEPQQTMCHSP